MKFEQLRAAAHRVAGRLHRTKRALSLEVDHADRARPKVAHEYPLAGAIEDYVGRLATDRYVANPLQPVEVEDGQRTAPGSRDIDEPPVGVDDRAFGPKACLAVRQPPGA